MVAYLLRRLLFAVPVLIGISLITFVLISFLPADPARMYAGPNASVEAINRIRTQLGLDQPFYVQYGRLVERAVQGDLGYSYQLQMPVIDAILARFPFTLQLTLAGIFVELLIGVPAGLLAAVRRSTWLDGTSMVVAMIGVSSPPSGWACSCSTSSRSGSACSRSVGPAPGSTSSSPPSRRDWAAPAGMPG